MLQVLYDGLKFIMLGRKFTHFWVAAKRYNEMQKLPKQANNISLWIVPVVLHVVTLVSRPLLFFI